MDQEVPIADYALVGDTRTAALVSSEGSIDWMCAPRFDGPPIFGRLIDRDFGGSFRIDVPGRTESTRRYLPGSPVLRNEISTATGRAVLSEAMVANVTGKLLPQSLLVRRLECMHGTVHAAVSFDPRWGLPGLPPERVRRAGDTVICEWASLAVALTTDHGPVAPGARVPVELPAGSALTVVLSIADRGPAIFVPPDHAGALIDTTDRWWRDWSNGLGYRGRHAEAVIRSLITMRLLTYSPSGAPVAAPTSSLPEAIGFGRNWDYRYAWPRDASIGVAAFLAAGDVELAHSFMHWLLHASTLTRPRMRVLYDVHGRPPPREHEVEVSGYVRSRPVRVGNAATEQHQLDVYGWVVDAAYLLERAGDRLHGETWRALAGFADFVSARWAEPDAGIWEVRGEPAHHTHSKLMAWLALDRILRLAGRRHVRASRLARWRRERDAISSWIRSEAVDHDRGTLVWKSGSSRLDASLLLLPVVEFEPVESPLTKGTIEAIRDDLELAPGLLLRYAAGSDGLGGDEGAFLPCSFWLVQALALTRRKDEAHDLFDRLVRCANDVGLLSEEIDPRTGAGLGNFPQAFTHATLVQAALALEAPPGRSEDAA